jgi:nitrous oxidase accessory protein NosD
MPCLYNIISENRVESRTRSYSGISVENSAYNVVYANYISGFSFGVELDMLAENNTFYHNNFVDSLTVHISVSEGELFSSNFWDNGEEGNYWDDYNGTDGNRDGIGDTPYVIDDANVDRYPLMFPFDIEGNAVVLPPPEPFPTTLVVAAVATVAVIGAVLAIYFKKRKH